MKLFKILSAFLSICLSLLVCQSALARSGGVDSQGGHYNRKTGEYHSYREAVAPCQENDIEAATHSKSTVRLSASENESKINDYFRETNENVGALNCNLMIHARDVDNHVKNRIKKRDGHRCVICGSTDKLEVDHRRALMNGGTNDESNLFTLCDKCHTVKTKYDSSLRRKRDSLCRTYAIASEALLPVPAAKPGRAPAPTTSESEVGHYPNPYQVGSHQSKVINTDGRFNAYTNGTVLDTRTNLMWAAKDNESNIDWQNAKNYCKNYRAGGYRDWRMPTQGELMALYSSGKGNYRLTSLITLTAPCPWASETNGFDAAYFDFLDGLEYWSPRSYGYNVRALPVRSGK
jgi:hypothetical protein